LEALAEALNQTPMIVGLGVAAAVLLAAFTLAERHAAEPIIPLVLFRNSTFTVAGAAPRHPRARRVYRLKLHRLKLHRLKLHRLKLACRAHLGQAEASMQRGISC